LNIIVTGGCGFIGSHLVETLLVMGHNILVIDDMRSGKWICKSPNVMYIKKDVCDAILPEGDFDAIVHLANTPRIRLALEQPILALRNNIDPTIHVADWARKLNCRLYFATSSSTIYSDKLSNPYTLGKSASEDILQMYEKIYNLKYNLMYFYNVYGPREADYGEHSTVIRCFKKAVVAGEPLRIFGSGRKTRDFTHVDDVIDGIIILLNTERKPKHAHLGTGSPHSIMEVATAFDQKFIHEFNRSGEAEDTLCKTPYSPCTFDVIQYITSWKQDFNESLEYLETQKDIN
jgi:UDP-glucose 4-epimerase